MWRHVGYTALLLFAGLQAIPNDVYEAAVAAYEKKGLQPAMEDIYGNGAPVSGLDETNDQINLILYR